MKITESDKKKIQRKIRRDEAMKNNKSSLISTKVHKNKKKYNRKSKDKL